MRRKETLFILLFVGMIGLHGCGEISSDPAATSDVERETVVQKATSMPLQYAENFTVDYYEGGYVLLTTAMDGRRFLIVPEDGETPRDLEKETVVLKRPVKDLYLVASSAMDMFRALDGIDSIAFSGQKEDGWYIEEARDAMRRGDLRYAGKYNMPDYEMIVSGGCTLAIENMMISHWPRVVKARRGPDSCYDRVFQL